MLLQITKKKDENQEQVQDHWVDGHSLVTGKLETLYKKDFTVKDEL